MKSKQSSRRERPLPFLAQMIGRSGVAALLACMGLVSALLLGTAANINLVPLQSALAFPCPQPLQLINGGFEQPAVPAPSNPPTQVAGWNAVNLGSSVFVAYFIPQGEVPGWQTTDSSGRIEIQTGNYNGTTPFEGNQWAELNSLEAAELYQVVDTSTLQGQTLTWSFAHHGFQGWNANPPTTDTAVLNIGPAGGPANFTYSATSGPTAWSVYSGTYTVPIGQTSTRFGWESLTGQGNGNYIDAVSFGTPGCSTDLAVEKTTDDTVFAPGAPITYDITITNTGAVAGQFDVIGATVADTVPADIEDVSWTCVASTGSACGNASGTGNDISETYDILEGGTVTYTVTGTVSATSTATELTNTATVAPPATTNGQPITDTDSSNNTSTATTPLAQPGIEVDKIADYTGPLTVGDVIPYRFVVTNTGDVALENVIVTDPLPGLSAITPASVATLAPGANTTFNATYTVTQDDVNAGALSNTASVTADPPGTLPPVTDGDTEIVPGEPDPQISIVKTNNGASATVGDTITYSFEVTNTGNITLNNVIVNDPLPGLSAVSPASYPSLAPGASTMFTATYVVTQTDVDRGSISNAATAFGETPEECTGCLPGVLATDDNLRFLAQRPALELVKSSDPIGGVQEGDIVTYSFLATNTGNVTLTDVTITDALPGLIWVTGPNVGDLAPGESATGTATYVVTQADIDTGAIHNTASVTGTPPDGCDCTPPTGTSEHDVPTAGTPGLDLVKSSDVPVGSEVGVGDVVTYTFTLTNTGNVDITDATITDDLPGLTWVTGPNLGTIAAGTSAFGTATYTVTQADVDAGSVQNAATADGDCGANCDVPPTEDEVEIPTDPAAPALDLEKSSDPAGGVELGDVITYTFTATNTGNVTLTDVTVSDALPGLSAIDPASVATLAPGETLTFTATYTVTASDVARGFVHNSASVTGEPPASCPTCEPPTDEDEHDVPTSGEAGILLDKEADTTSPVTLGQTITYTFTVTNTGDVNFENVAITDPMPGLSAIDCPQTTLVAGTSMQCTATYLVTQADIDRGRVDNAATVTGDPVDGGDPVTDGDDESVPTEPQIPGLELDKNSDTPGPVAVGDVITYTFTATNTGNVSLSDVTITDIMGGLAWVTGPELGDLAPGETATGSATYVVTQADVDAGQVYNSATVSGTPPDTCVDCPIPTDPGEETVITEDPVPAVDLTKEADTAGPVELGDVITYTFTATNTGNVTLDNVTVGDELPGLTWVTGPNLGTLAPGESATGTATYTVTEADITAGVVTNTATITVEPRCEDCDPIYPEPPIVEVPVVPAAPAIDFTKEADTGGPVAVGDTITYTFTATNTGNVTLDDVTLDDQLPGLTWVTGPNLGTLAPGESATGTATYVVTQDDVDAGHVANTATITVDPVCDDCDPVYPPPPIVDIPTDDPNPAVDLTKEADTAGPVNVGDTITYTFTATNTGNVTLDDVTIDDQLPGLTWVTGPSLGTLTPGQSATGTATYVVTESDINAGVVTNTATISVDPRCEECDPVYPEPPVVEIPVDPAAPSVGFTKEADTAGPVAVGDTITYTFTATNTGNVTLNDVTITDNLPGLVWVTGPNLGALTPGQVTTGIATYVVTQADVDGGSVVNTATISVVPVCDTACEPVYPPPPVIEVLTGGESGILIEKDSDTDGPVDVGDVITYTFTVMNTGAVSLTNITVDDPKIGNIFCANELGVGETVTCSAPYTVTQADVDAGQVYNSATVAGTTPDGGTSSDDDDDTVTTVNPCDLVETPLADEAFNLSLRALQVDPSTPIIDPTVAPPTETATEEPTLEPTETVTETATVDPGTPELTETATEEATLDSGTPTVNETPTPDGTPQVSPSCPSPTPQPTPTPKPQNPGGGGGGGNGGTGGVGGGNIPPVTTLPGTGANANSTDDQNGLILILFIAVMSALGAIGIGLNRAKRGTSRR